jgi:hypothetical protein
MRAMHRKDAQRQGGRSRPSQKINQKGATKDRPGRSSSAVEVSMTNVDRDAVQAEVDRNYQIFEKELPNLAAFNGKFALMHDGKIIHYYDTVADAVGTGKIMYSDDIFSVQQVQTEPVNLGFLSHAVPSS